MARYMLTGINDEDWKRFKAYCDLQGVTLKEMLTSHIEEVVKAFNLEHHHPRLTKPKQKKRGKTK